jgi:DNA-binding transcriptional regulator YdaS (Cro superfamily)
MRSVSLDITIKRVGSIKALAEISGVTPQGVSQWTDIPLTRVREISAKTGIPLYELRPDFWEPPASDGGGERAAWVGNDPAGKAA